MAQLLQAASVIQSWWIKEMAVREYNRRRKCPCRWRADRFAPACDACSKSIETRSNCPCNHGSNCTRCDIFYYGPEEEREDERERERMEVYDGATYTCRMCSVRYKNKYHHTHGTNYCRDCDWKKYHAERAEDALQAAHDEFYREDYAPSE
jgi:hypothetical protein